MSIESDIRALDDKLEKLDKRIKELEKHSHEPYDFTEMENRLKHLESFHLKLGAT